MTMKNSHSKLLFFLCTIFILVTISIAQQQQLPDFLYYKCIKNGNYTNNSTYQKNLQTLLSNISSNTQIDYGFYNASVGLNSDRANAIALCRGDVSLDTCRSCIKNSTQKLTQICPFYKEAIGWYNYCMLRYSNRSNIFGTRETSPAYYKWNLKNVSDAEKFNEALGNLMSNLKDKAASGDSRRKFATGSVNATSFQNIYGLVQCTPDLSELQCSGCLEGAINDIPKYYNNRIGGTSIKPSCNIRHEVGQFYESSSTPPADFAPPTSTNTTRTKGKEGFSSGIIIAIVVPIGVALVVFCIICCCCLRKKAKSAIEEQNDENDIMTVDFLQYDLDKIQSATNNFSDENKIGEGGFGSVYKGILSSGQEVAVKRLSRSSGQGANEFKNEVVLVAKLQHRNLVRLLGFCLEREEKLLIYEFVPNKSLDYFLFEPEKQGQLDWSRRYKIIEGIARGILYLHVDSRLRIIHRDLKASNVLLDEDMNAKISDFGMAKIFGVDQTQGNTSRIVGTYGYMSPEYAMHGQFSVKSDVYSFGVLVLEIVCGKKNSSFYQSDVGQNLLSYAWRQWREGTPLELMDPILRETYSRNEVMRCIHIGLLCVQEDLADRPSMSSVVLMLSSFSITLPLPREPAYFVRSGADQSLPIINEFESDQSTSRSIPFSVNETSITDLEPR